MDDLLISANSSQMANEVAQVIVLALQERGFVIAPEKNTNAIPLSISQIPVRTYFYFSPKIYPQKITTTYSK